MHAYKNNVNNIYIHNIYYCNYFYQYHRRLLAMTMLLRLIGMHKPAFEFLLGQLEGLVEKGLRKISIGSKATEVMDVAGIERVIHIISNLSTVMADKLSRLNTVGRVMRRFQAR